MSRLLNLCMHKYRFQVGISKPRFGTGITGINKNQKEENHRDLISFEAVEKMRGLTDEAKLFFCTDDPTGETDGV